MRQSTNSCPVGVLQAFSRKIDRSSNVGILPSLYRKSLNETVHTIRKARIACGQFFPFNIPVKLNAVPISSSRPFLWVWPLHLNCNHVQLHIQCYMYCIHTQTSNFYSSTWMSLLYQGEMEGHRSMNQMRMGWLVWERSHDDPWLMLACHQTTAEGILHHLC